MKVAVLRKPFDIVIQDVDVPKIEDYEVLIKIAACSICGSDLHLYHGTSTHAIYPTIPGHEIAGVIDKVGRGVKDVMIGERVTADDDITCRSCRWCLSGRPNLCPDRHILGSRFDGGYAEYLKVPAENLHRIPDNIPFEHACVGQTLGIGYHGVVDRGNVQLGDFVVVLGSGPVGLSVIAISKAFGARVLSTDIIPYRLEVAKKLGADFVVNPLKEDVLKRILDLTDGEGADKVFECAGGSAHEVTFKQAMDVVRTAGRIVNLGLFSTPHMQINLAKITTKEIEVTGSIGVRHRIGAALKLMSQGKIDVTSIVTHVMPLEDVKRGLELMDKKLENAVKVALKP